MSFKTASAEDISKVFLNGNDFAEKHNIHYNGMTYSQISVILTKQKESERPALTSGSIHSTSAGDNMQGVFMRSFSLYAAVSDFDGIVPEYGHEIEIDDGEALGHPFYKRYRITGVDCDMGMVHLILEAYDE